MRVVKIKKLVKKLIYYLSLVLVFPLYVVYLVLGRRSFTCFSELISLLPGYCGYFVRRAFYRLSLGVKGNLDVGFGSILQYDSIKVGGDVYIGQQCNIAKCSLGSGVKIGSGVHIVNKYTHDVGKNGEILPTDVEKLKRVKIGERTWIGNMVVVMADVGDRCIIGAGSVVTKKIPDNSVAVGNPAKVIKKNG